MRRIAKGYKVNNNRYEQDIFYYNTAAAHVHERTRRDDGHKGTVIDIGQCFGRDPLQESSGTIEQQDKSNNKDGSYNYFC